MRRFIYCLLPVFALITCVVLGNSFAQQADSTQTETAASKAAKFQIVPLIVIKPGETQELLMSTWCTVGVTRGGGFQLAEMRDGKAQGSGEKSYSRAGLTITVPNFDDAEKLAAAPEYALLKKNELDPFVVTITAAADAQPELFEMHLVDATCSGHCKTDFRVLVTKP
jgi:hypothetical protein